MIRTLLNQIFTSMLRFLFICFLVNMTLGAYKEENKVVILDEGGVQGEKYWNGEFYEFYGVPYATVPKGKDRFQAPLPPEPWSGVMTAKSRSSRCYQAYLTADDEEPFVDGEEDCLFMNLFVPKIATEDNQVPVVVYIHSGAFSGGNGNMAQYHYLARQDVLVVSFNYRLGSIGFACLGNKEIPGNAGMKDQVAALRWINKNIVRFGGDPKKVTIAGFSVGAAMAELLALSETTDGLVDKMILESGSALSPFTIDRDPVSTARNMAISVGFNDTGSLKDLTEFFLESSFETLVSKGHNFFLTNSTFGFSPCIENVHDGIEAFLTESPLDIIKKGKNKQVDILTGFANMEGLSRSIKFDEWSEKMNAKFDDFLPADLIFDNNKNKESFIKKIKIRYFKDKEVSQDTLQGYVDYFSDSMFKYSILKSAKAHAEKTKRSLYLYEFSYVGELNAKHFFMDKITGASHRDQTAYVLDFFGFTNKYRDLDTRDRMTMMWADFVKYGDPTAYESQLIDFKWLNYTSTDPNYLEIDTELTLKKGLFEEGFRFWSEVYDKYYRNPKAPKIVVEEPKPLKKSDSVDQSNIKKVTEEKIDRTLLREPVKYEPKSDNKPVDDEEITKPQAPEAEQKTVYANEPVKTGISKENTVEMIKEPEDPAAKSKGSRTDL